VHQEGALREKNAPEPAPNKIKIIVFGDFGLTEGPRYQGIAHAKRRLADEVFNANLRRAQHLRTDQVSLRGGSSEQDGA
jgi:hypothetical protein